MDAEQIKAAAAEYRENQRVLTERQARGLCANCGLRAGTLKWYGEGGVLAMSHGFYSMWCNTCAVKEQLDYARKQAARIPELEEEYAKLADLEDDRPQRIMPDGEE